MLSPPCPCGSQKSSDACCAGIINSVRTAETAEALMRSRYTAFTIRDMNYLLTSTHISKRDTFDLEGNRRWAAEATFEKLEILETRERGDRGWVNFKATFRMAGKTLVHAESSSFLRENGVWYFLDGIVT